MKVRFNFLYPVLFSIVTGMFFSVPISAATGSTSQWILNAEQWELNRTDRRITTIPALNQLVKTWLGRVEAEPDLKMILQYPGGEEGEIWVQEVADWLVTYGIPSHYIIMQPGSAADDMIKLSLR